MDPWRWLIGVLAVALASALLAVMVLPVPRLGSCGSGVNLVLVLGTAAAGASWLAVLLLGARRVRTRLPSAGLGGAVGNVVLAAVRWSDSDLAACVPVAGLGPVAVAALGVRSAARRDEMMMAMVTAMMTTAGVVVAVGSRGGIMRC